VIPLVQRLGAPTDTLRCPSLLTPCDGVRAAAACEEAEVGGGKMDEKTFRFMLNADGCTIEKIGGGASRVHRRHSWRL